jgi:hypothetical protein
MGYTSNTNIELIAYDPNDIDHDTLTETIEKNAIVIYDNESGINITAFEGLYVKPENLAPKLVSVAGGKGGGGVLEVAHKISELLLDSTSNLYLPTIIVNGFITKITVDGTIRVLKLLFKKFKSVHRRKRFRLIYYSKESFSYFEFPSETNENDFEDGIEGIPKAVEGSLKGKYFTRSLRSGIWVEEDIDR